MNYYAKEWYSREKVAEGFMSPEEAEGRYRSGENFTVLVGSDTSPSRIIDFYGESFAVGFLDDRLREYLEYRFQKVGDRRLFLSMAVHREFDGAQEKPARGITFFFKEDGRVYLKERVAATREAWDSETTADVSGHYSEYPKFGCYEDLLRVER